MSTSKVSACISVALDIQRLKCGTTYRFEKESAKIQRHAMESETFAKRRCVVWYKTWTVTLYAVNDLLMSDQVYSNTC